MIQTIGVVGAGTMGRGIALAAALSGYSVWLFDNNAQALENARMAIGSDVEQLVKRGKLTEEAGQKIAGAIAFLSDISACRADLIIEAIIEKEDAKVSLFNSLSQYNADNCLFASNTSSLSIHSLQQKIKNPSRVAGMHFFNPAHIMKLVEVVKGEQTAQGTIDTLVEVCAKMNKTSVVCSDAPGFIVNRVARHYYLEAMRIAEKEGASFEQIDKIMEATGFKMGPFKLMDLIGMDINLAVSRSIYDAFHHAPRFAPSSIQIKKVEHGDLGRKTGKGFYSYFK